MAEQRGRSIVGIVVIAIACALLFLVPSAWVIERGHSNWHALAAGLLVFPVLPGVWHLVGERRRKHGGAKGTLTGGDRFLMRLIAVALITIGPLLLFQRHRTWVAVKHHPAWFVHWGGGGSSGGGDLGSTLVSGVSSESRVVALVPGDAEVVVWLRATDALVKSMTKQFGGEAEQAPDPDQAQEVVMAMRRDALLLAYRGKGDVSQDEVDKAEKELTERVFGRRVHMVARNPASDLHLVVTENWSDAVGEREVNLRPGPTELLATLDRLPTDAPLVAAASKTALAGVVVDQGTANLRVADKKLVITAEMQVASGPAAAALRAAITALIDAQRKELPDSCKQAAGKLLDAFRVGGDGNRVSLDARLDGEDLVRAAFCKLGDAKSHD